MAVPATQGKQCKYLEEMEIGDYIRCTYTATAANVAGEFSDLGGFVDSYEKHQQQVDSEGNPVVEADGKPVMDTVKKSYDELPVIPGNVVKGYFYFLKVDKGLLIADRKLQKNISYGVLNSAQMTTGWKFKNICLIRLGTRDEYVRYLEKSNLNGTIIIQDSNVWHDFKMQTAGDIFDANINCYLELVQDARAGECRTVLNISGAVNSASTHFSGRYNYNGGIQDVSILIYQNITSASNYYYHYKGVNLYQLFCFRPVLEYIDNPNSKTIYF